jgi:ribonuclease P protein component
MPGHERLRGSRRFRLTGVGAFETVFRDGRWREGDLLQLIAAPAGTPPGRVGFVVGRKAFPRAVDRNRVRRLLREAVRRARPGIEAFDMILRATRGCPRQDTRRFAVEADRLLAALVAGPLPPATTTAP